ncbi:MAG: site-2 protease family protein [Oscillospiraceae bacterium]
MKKTGEMRFLISPGFLLTSALLFYLDGSVVFWVFGAAVLHELGHLMAVYLLGGRAKSLRLTMIGAAIELDGSRQLSYPGEFLSALAGPAVSFLAAWCGARLGLFLFAGLSLALGIFNLLPVKQLDGGRCLYALTAWWRGPEEGERALFFTGCLTISALLGAGVGVLKLYGNFTLLLMSLWLLLGMVERNRQK